jgi:hypothetical protein
LSCSRAGPKTTARGAGAGGGASDWAGGPGITIIGVVMGPSGTPLPKRMLPSDKKVMLVVILSEVDDSSVESVV